MKSARMTSARNMLVYGKRFRILAVSRRFYIIRRNGRVSLHAVNTLKNLLI